jgi:hypothetical protein
MPWAPNAPLPSPIAHKPTARPTDSSRPVRANEPAAASGPTVRSAQHGRLGIYPREISVLPTAFASMAHKVRILRIDFFATACG